MIECAGNPSVQGRSKGERGTMLTDQQRRGLVPHRHPLLYEQVDFPVHGHNIRVCAERVEQCG